MELQLRYGRGTLPVRLPEDADVTVIRKPAMPLLKDAASAVSDALDYPVSAAPLQTIASTAGSAAIAVCDITRPVPNGLFLRPIIERLRAGGIPREKITIIIATGLHRPNLGQELSEVLGDPWVQDQVQVVNHDARDDESHYFMGKTRDRGSVIRLDRRFVEADLKIATGLVEPHFMAGYSGGRKVIAPGLAHSETITTFHNARFMADPGAVNCNLKGNPLHEEQMEIVEMLGGALALNTVIDEARQLSYVNFGEIVESHGQAVDFVKQYCEVAVARRFSTVVTSAAGYPLDKTYYQTVKGMVGVMDILEPGGNLIIASEISEGMGSVEFVAAQQRLQSLGPDAFMKAIGAQQYARIDEWQTQMQLKPMAVGTIQLYSTGLAPNDYPLTGVEMIDSIENAVRKSVERSGDRAIAVVPEGPYVVPSCNNTNQFSAAA